MGESYQAGTFADGDVLVTVHDGEALFKVNGDGAAMLTEAFLDLAGPDVLLASCAELQEWSGMARGSLELYIQREDPVVPESKARMRRQNRLRCEDLAVKPVLEDALRPRGMRIAGERGGSDGAFLIDVRYSSYDVIIYADGPGMSLLADAFSDAVTCPAGHKEVLLAR
ncbi:hypothetical protein VJ923_07385 [Adlercreutzia sp. R25]|uniref:Uncharacterized protein n=1 Tax=Adlercreutzia shanghongiae TaxID=3111773 RepID=A0ABU6IZF3_9ACTN|nr:MULTISPECIES: hypothetical protein [unclassified Adlercreutzia]MEC4272977.1 hypothetical protein [Adlercreutzia sp. R25]MEC4295232.1 hypothetical protein [Adlercreutzia sp. R22]